MQQKLQHPIVSVIAYFLQRCMECRRALALRILSVRPSLCQTCDLWQNERMMCPDLYHTKDHLA